MYNILNRMANIPLINLHSNLTLEQQYYHLKDMVFIYIYIYIHLFKK